jgi:hypothetical protein
MDEAQWEMREFSKIRGEGKTVTPTIEGLALLARVVAQVVKDLDCLQ